MLACDSDCPNWKALGICAHSVAVAELSGKLPVFIERIKKCNKRPSISKFAEATMPKGRGRKGGETNRKRKEPPTSCYLIYYNPLGWCSLHRQATNIFITLFNTHSNVHKPFTAQQTPKTAEWGSVCLIFQKI